MSAAKCADAVQVQLLSGVKYAFCTCGGSAKYPCCDGTHRGTEFRPVKFVAEQDEQAWLCVCKKSKSPPRCDGTGCPS
ncbi:CDGSH iron-sulfur domain-containing protein [Planctomicrobium piriforme]|uniref:Iron-binding zinc finger CDGSH type n=1 Tax=Planctomicrobium piriforme TaxID=1576369 RepID=A0A1I3HU61_9PLAN|nr:CDGSH iron-sulfur domain-containing protein [Planctomicrobium piriforme]SFI39097.1 Iron-binding zinc finger CDGSH type [Planctomicrobium piriforme]